MKNLLTITSLVLAMLFATVAKAQGVSAVKAKITLTPSKVQIPSTGEYVYLAKTLAGTYALFVSKDEKLYERFSQKKDSVITLEGAEFKPLQHYSKKQWKKLSKEIKLFFPMIGQQELEKMKLYLLFNWDISPKEEKNNSSSSSDVTKNNNTGNSRKEDTISIP